MKLTKKSAVPEAIACLVCTETCRLNRPAPWMAKRSLISSVGIIRTSSELRRSFLTFISAIKPLIKASVLASGVVSGPPPQQVAVPNLIGLTEAQADAAITGASVNAGLVVGTDVLQSNTAPAGTVIGQTPQSGTLVNFGSTVTETISTGPPAPTYIVQQEKVTYGGVLSGTYGVALTKPQTAGNWIVATISPSANVTVSDSWPETYAQGPDGTWTAKNIQSQSWNNVAFHFGVSTTNPVMTVTEYSFTPLPPPSGTAAVPSVDGMTQAAASSAITGANLVVGTVTQASSTTVASGNVISQNPVASTSVASGSKVDLVVSSGPPPPAQVAVPNAVGMTEVNADNAITGAGLTVTDVFAANPTIAQGTVISQSPAAGTMVAPVSAVPLNISSGSPPPPPTGTVPGTPVPQSAAGIVPTGNIPIGSRTLKFYADFTHPSYQPFNRPEVVSIDNGTTDSIWYALAGQPGGMNTKFNATEGDPFSTAKGYLTIHANASSPNPPPPYGGMISSVAHSFNEPPGTVVRGFWATNAYWEVKAFVPAQGSERWCAAWILGSTAHIDPATNGYGEVDIFEFPTCSQNLHFYPVDPVTHKVTSNQQPGTFQPLIPSVGWHVWGCLVEGDIGRITIYIDGVLSHQFTGLTSAWNVPLQILLDNSFGTGFPATGEAGWTNDLGVMYVRCWAAP
jgi:beta-lactam-binding protein with PASTA domain